MEETAEVDIDEVSQADAQASGQALALLTVAGLYGALKTRLDALAAKFWRLESRKTEKGYRAPVIFPGWLPPKKRGEDGKEMVDIDRYPFLLIRPKTVVDAVQSAEANSMVTTEIIIGTYSDDDDGWLDVLLIIDAIRFDLGERPILAGTAYEHFGPLVGELPTGEQARPLWHGIVTTNWQIPRPERADAED